MGRIRSFPGRLIGVLMMCCSVASGAPDDPRQPATGSKREADFSKVIRITPTFAEPWAVTPNKAPAVVVSKKPMVLTGDANVVGGMLLRTHTGVAAVLRQQGMPGPGMGTAVERVDLIRGTVGQVTSIHASARVTAVSPNGDLVMAMWHDNSSESNRLELWKIGTKIAQRSISFIPFTGAQPAARIERAGFVNDDVGYVLSKEGELTVWQLSTATAIWQTNVSPLYVCISPGTRQLFAQKDDRLICFEALTGKVLGSVKVIPLQVGGIDINPEANTLMVVSKDRFFTVDLTRATFSGDVGRDSRGYGLGVTSLESGFALCGGTIFDTTRLMDVRAMPTAMSVMPAGGRVFRIMAEKGRRGIVSFEFPGDEIAESIEQQMKAEKRFAVLPGTHVKLDLQLKSEPTQTPAVAEYLKAQIKANGWVLDDNATVRVVAKHYVGKKFGVPAVGSSPLDPSRKIALLSIESGDTPLWSVYTQRADGFWTDLFTSTKLPSKLLKPIALPIVEVAADGVRDGRLMPVPPRIDP